MSESAIINDQIYERLQKRLAEAEQKHPVFAEGPFQALGVLGEEYGEAVRSLTKQEGYDRMQEELLDVLAVAWRFYRGDWRTEQCK